MKAANSITHVVGNHRSFDPPLIPRVDSFKLSTTDFEDSIEPVMQNYQQLMLVKFIQ
jgi:hypothetical protein